MSIETISAGQRDWVKTLNDDFTELGKQSYEADVMLSNGFSPIDNEKNSVKALPLPNGITLKILQLNMKIANVKDSPFWDTMVTVPEGFGSGMPRPVGLDASVTIDGHYQGYFSFFWKDSSHLGCGYVPLNGEDGPWNFDNIRTTILYY